MYIIRSILPIDFVENFFIMNELRLYDYTFVLLRFMN